MKHVPILGVAVTMVAAIMLISGALSAQSMGPTTQRGQNLNDNATLLGPQADNQDLDTCQQGCRSRFGYDIYVNPQRRGGSGGSGAYYAYAKCIADCNRRFWRSFDKEMDELEKE